MEEGIRGINGNGKNTIKINIHYAVYVKLIQNNIKCKL